MRAKPVLFIHTCLIECRIRALAGAAIEPNLLGEYVGAIAISGFDVAIGDYSAVAVRQTQRPTVDSALGVIGIGESDMLLAKSGATSQVVVGLNLLVANLRYILLCHDVAERNALAPLCKEIIGTGKRSK